MISDEIEFFEGGRMMTLRSSLAIWLLVVSSFLAMFCAVKSFAQSANDTDYVVMFDTSMSMNNPPDQPTLGKVKKALKDMVENTWLPHSKRQDQPARLYFYPFDAEPHPHRSYELTTSGVQDFIAYLDGLEANGTNTAIIDTLELVLDTVPQIAISGGRNARRQYILLTDGEEMVRRDWVDQKLLEKLLRKWGKELKVESRDSLFLLRVGEVKGSFAEKNHKALKRQVEKVKEEGVPVNVGKSLPDRVFPPETKPARYEIEPKQPSISLAGRDRAGIEFELSGFHLPKEKPSGLALKGRFQGDVPEHCELSSDTVEVSDSDWSEIQSGGKLTTGVDFEFNPPSGIDVEDQGVVVWTLKDSNGNTYSPDIEISVNVSSRGRAQVAFEDTQFIISADRIDNKTTTHEVDFLLNRDAAVDQRAGKIFVEAAPSWPEDNVKVLLDGRPVESDFSIDFENKDLETQHQLKFIINEQAGFTQYGGSVKFTAEDCQIKSIAGISNHLEIPWQVQGKPIPQSLVTLTGTFPINGKLSMNAEQATASEKLKFTHQVAFSLEGEAGEQARNNNYEIVVRDIELPIPADIDPERNWRPRDPRMKVTLDGQEKSFSEFQCDAVTVGIELPGDAQPGKYNGKLQVEIRDAKFVAQGLGSPVSKVDLYWAVTVLEQKPTMITILSPTVDQVIRFGKEPGGVDTPLPRQVIRLDFGDEVLTDQEALVSVSVSPRDFFPKGSISLDPTASIAALDMVLPTLVEAGEHEIELRFFVENGNLLFGNGKSSVSRSLKLLVDPAPIPSASLIKPMLKANQNFPLNAKWVGGEVASVFSLELDFNAEAKRKNTEVSVVDESGEVVGKLSSLNSNLNIPIRHQSGEVRLNKKFRLSSADSEFVFSNGKNFLEFEIDSEVDDFPKPKVVIDSSGISSYLSFEFSEEEQEIEEIVRFTWSEEAKWLNSRLNLRPLSDMELGGQPRLIYLDPPLNSIDSSVTELRIFTRIPGGLEAGSFSERFQIIPEGDLVISETEWNLERESLSKPMTTAEIAKLLGIAVAVLLVAAFVGKKMYDKKFGDPVFSGSFFCDVQSEELSALRLKGSGDSSMSFGGDYSEGADYPLNFTLTAVKAASRLTCKVEFSEPQSGNQHVSDLQIFRFDQDGDRHDFVSGESVTGGDRLEVLDGSRIVIEISFRGLSVGSSSDVKDETFGESDFDDFDEN